MKLTLWPRGLIVLLPLFVFLFSSCAKVYEEKPLVSCTVLAYLAGDNNLSKEIAQKIEALRQGAVIAGCGALLIYVDTPAGASLQRLSSDQSLDTIEIYGKEDSASPEVFRRVLLRAFDLAPAERRGLIFFSHASGWLPSGMLQNPTRSIGWDDSDRSVDHTEMELSEFSAAIPDGFLDFILFEACLMSGVEVAYSLRTKADFMLASSAEIVSPGFTPIYSTALSSLMAQQGTVEESLKYFGQTYMAYVNRLDEPSRSATLSLIDLQEMEHLAVCTSSVIGKMTRPIDLSSMQHFDRPGSYGDLGMARYYDLQEWIESAIDTPADYMVWREQLQRVVKWSFCTKYFLLNNNGFEILRHSGLTVYIEQEEFSKLNEMYHSTSWWQFINQGR